MIWLGLTVALVSRVLVGGMLVAAGGSKLIAGQGWRLQWLRGFGLLPESTLSATAWALPVIETLSGAALLVGAAGRLAAAAAVFVLGLVTVVLCLSLLLGRRPDCGCRGAGRRVQLISWRLVARNLVLIGLVWLGTVQLAPGADTWPAAAQAVVTLAVAITAVWGLRLRVEAATRRMLPMA